MPRVSVQIPAYNSGRFIANAIESILSQTYHSFEIIVIDDGSTDNTADVVSRYPQVRYLRQKHSGISAARNRGVEEANGEYIAFLDADDLWTPDKLEKQMAYLEEHPQCQMVFSEIENFIDEEVESVSHRQSEILETELEYCLVSCLMKRSLFTRYGGFDENYGYGEDTELLARLKANRVDMTRCLPEKLYLRRIHQTNTSLNHKKVSKEEYLALLAKAFRKARKETQ